MKKLGALLQEQGLIDDVQLIRALSHQRKWRCKLGRSLVELGYVDEETVAKTVARQYGLQYIDFDPSKTPRELFDRFSPAQASEKTFFPVGYNKGSQGEQVVVALFDPDDRELIDDLGRQAGGPILPVMAKESSINEAVAKWSGYSGANPLGDSRQPTFYPAPSPPPPQDEDEIQDLEDAEIVEDLEKVVETRGAAVGSPPPKPIFDSTDDVVLGGAPTDFGEAQFDQQLLSVSDLPPLDGMDPVAPPPPPTTEASVPPPPPPPAPTSPVEQPENIPPVEPEGASEIPMDSSPVEPVEMESSDMPEGMLEQSQPWEHVMPDQVQADREVAEQIGGQDPLGLARDATGSTDEDQPAPRGPDTSGTPSEFENDGGEPEELPIDAIAEVSDEDESAAEESAPETETSPVDPFEKTQTQPPSVMTAGATARPLDPEATQPLPPPDPSFWQTEPEPEQTETAPQHESAPGENETAPPEFDEPELAEPLPPPPIETPPLRTSVPPPPPPAKSGGWEAKLGKSESSPTEIPPETATRPATEPSVSEIMVEMESLKDEMTRLKALVNTLAAKIGK